jgi:cell wall-associated NlpC family hydrolase
MTSMTARPSTIRRARNLLAVTALALCATVVPLSAQVTITRPHPVDAAKPFARLNASILSIRDSIVAVALQQRGVRYRRGAESPDKGFDCSGLVQYVMAQFGAKLPRTSRQQALVGKKIERNIAALKPGDLLTFGHGKRISHVAIYIGNGRYIHAPVPGGEVREESLAHTRSSWWKGARRVLAFDEPIAPDSVIN